MTPIWLWLQLRLTALHLRRQFLPSTPTRRPIRKRPCFDIEPLETRAVPTASNGLAGHYFADMALNREVLTRTDPIIDFNWGWNTAPNPALPSTRFSARWVGELQAPTTKTYTFSTLSDDGVRLLINGQHVIDNWTNHSPTEDRGTISLTAGQRYPIEVDYFQNTGNAIIQLGWMGADQTREVIPTQYLFTDSAAPPSVGGDTTPPTATLSVGDITRDGYTGWTFRVIYRDDVAIDPATIPAGQLRVTAPNGYDRIADLIRVEGTGSSRTVVYRIPGRSGAWAANDNETYSIAISGSVTDTSGNSVPSGVLGTFRVRIPGGNPGDGNPPPPTDWWSTHLHDPGITNVARQVGSDGNLTRNDMVTIFRAAESGGVTGTKLDDLRTLVANASTLGMPDYVRVLANKVVNGDPANQHFQAQVLGNLFAGSSGQQLEQLLDKWFLGQDHPEVSSDIHYVTPAGSLFGAGGPILDDLRQGHLGDCYVLAGLGEVTFRTPDVLRSAFIDNGDGTFTVRFYHDGIADYVTVDKLVPAAFDGTYWYANVRWQTSDASIALWPSLLEKAYAQLAEAGWSRPGKTTNSYGAIDGGWEGTVVRQLTGRNTTFQYISDSTSVRDAIVTSFQSGALVGLDTKQTTDSSTGIRRDHAYVLIGYNQQTGVFTLFNPLGYRQEVTWPQIAANMLDWSWTIN